jgi:hypothetical protein
MGKSLWDSFIINDFGQNYHFLVGGNFGAVYRNSGPLVACTCWGTTAGVLWSTVVVVVMFAVVFVLFFMFVSPFNIVPRAPALAADFVRVLSF